MIKKVFYLLLLHEICQCLPSTQNFDAEIWSSSAQRGNRGLLYQTDVSQINNLADFSGKRKQQAHINCGYENHNQNLENNSKEQLYVFLDKGVPRYMPLNEHEKTVVKYSPININGRDVHLSDQQVFQQVGLNPEMLSDGGQEPYNNFRANKRNFPKQSIQKTTNYYKNSDENKRNNYRNTVGNNYYQRSSHNNPTDVPNNQPISKNFICKKNNIVKNRPAYKNAFEKNRPAYKNAFEKNKPAYNNPYEHNSYKTKFIRDCKSKPKYEQNNKKNKAVIKKTNYRVEYTESEAIVGSTHNQSNVAHNHAKNKTVVQKHTPKKLNSSITIHRGIIQVSRPKDVKITTNNVHNINSNKSLESSVQNDIENDRPETRQTEPPLLGTAQLTDSPIFFIKIRNNGKILTNTETTENIQDLSRTEIRKMAQNPLDAEVLGKSETQPVIKRDFEIESTTAATTENQILEITTVKSELTTTQRSSNENTDMPTDLAGNEDRLYAYITKLEKKPRKSRKKKSSQKKSEHMEPIAYETFQMQPPENPRKHRTEKKRRNTPKPKRFIELRSTFMDLKKSRKTVTTTVKPTTPATTSTMSPQIHTFKSENLIKNFDAENPNRIDYENNYYKRDFLAGSLNRSDNDISNPELLGSNHFPSIDPCQNSKGYNQIFNGVPEYDMNESQSSNDVLQHHRKRSHDYQDFNQAEPHFYDSEEFSSYYTDSTESDFNESEIHGMQEDCSDSTEVKYDDDQHYRLVDKVTPASRNIFSVFC